MEEKRHYLGCWQVWKKIDEATIIFNNESYDLKNESFDKNILGFVFQDFQLFPHKTVLENLTLSPIYTQKK